MKGPPRDTRYVDVYHEKPVKISVKVLVPVKEHPRVSACNLFIFIFSCIITHETFSSTLLENC